MHSQPKTASAWFCPWFWFQNDICKRRSHTTHLSPSYPLFHVVLASLKKGRMIPLLQQCSAETQDIPGDAHRGDNQLEACCVPREGLFLSMNRDLRWWVQRQRSTNQSQVTPSMIQITAWDERICKLLISQSICLPRITKKLGLFTFFSPNKPFAERGMNKHSRHISTFDKKHRKVLHPLLKVIPLQSALNVTCINGLKNMFIC